MGRFFSTTFSAASVLVRFLYGPSPLAQLMRSITKRPGTVNRTAVSAASLPVFALMLLAFMTVSAAFGESTVRGLTSLFIGLALGLVLVIALAQVSLGPVTAWQVYLLNPAATMKPASAGCAPSSGLWSGVIS